MGRSSEELGGVDSSSAPAVVSGEPVDYVPSGKITVPSGKKSRTRANLRAIELLDELDRAGRYATAEEQQVLAAYSGWGAIPELFEEKLKSFASERAQLRGLLPEEEYAQARQAILTSHYTDPALVSAMWQALEGAGFNGGMVLEPGCGSGNFLGAAPEPAQMVGVELDRTSARIAHYLYPSATIYAQGYQEIRLPGETISAAVGNVPFSGFIVQDKQDNTEQFKIHNYFINKTMKNLALGGYGLFITSEFTMNTKNSRARAAIAEHSDLVAAVRLPNHAFSRVAGTKVGTDILVFRRRKDNEAIDRVKLKASWVDGLQKTTSEGEKYFTSRFFDQNPHYVLGDIQEGKNQYGQVSLVVTSPDSSAVLADKVRFALNKQIQQAKAEGKGYSPDLAAGAVERIEKFAPGGLTVFGAEGVFNGAVRHNQAINNLEVYSEATGEWSPITKNRPAAAKLRESVALIGLKEKISAVLAVPYEEKAQALEELSGAYEKYVETYGPINRFTLEDSKPKAPEVKKRLREARENWLEGQDTEGLSRKEIKELRPDSEVLAQWEEEANAPEKVKRQAHLTFLKSDPDFGKLVALEKFDEDTQKAQKSKLFELSTYAPKQQVLTAETPADALSVSLDESRSVDLGRIASLLGVSEEAALEQLGGLVYRDPVTSDFVPAVSYLAGNVREKLDEAQAAVINSPEFERNVAALKAVTPQWVPLEKMNLQLGASYLPASFYQHFTRDTFDKALEIAWMEEMGRWSIKRSDASLPVMVKANYGTKRQGPSQLFEKVMNNKQPKVFDKVHDSETGKEQRVLNMEETKKARAKAIKIEMAFQKWVTSSPDRVAQVEEAYNRRFNSYVAPDYTELGKVLELPGISSEFTPHPYQREAVARIVNEPAVLLDHVVGAGKTGSMIMGALELKRRGMIQQPLFVVPNHLVEQIGREFTQWAPAAQVLMIPSGITLAERRTYAMQSLAGDWDAVIMAQSTFSKVGISAGRRHQFLQEDIERLQEQRVNDSIKNDYTVKQLQGVIKTLENRAEKLNQRKDDNVTFESLGCDYLFVDEAHDYKNLARISDYQELSHAGSMRATDLEYILRALRENKIEASEGKNTVPAVATFATGTPIANSLSELWVMTKYLRPDLLKQMGISSIDAWARVFAKPEMKMEVQPSGVGFRVVESISEFKNLEQLKVMTNLFMSTVLRHQIPMDLPDVVNGAATINERVASHQVQDYMKEIERIIRAPREGEYVIEALGRARRVALDPRFVGLEPDPDGGRARQLASQVARIEEQYAQAEYLDDEGQISAQKGGLQIVFCDQGTPGGDTGFNFYEAMIDEMVAAGIPAERIAVIHDAGDEEERKELFLGCREGRYSVLLGSTSKMGTGMNVQNRVTAIHHVDVPWKPADLEQREGRGIRQKNQNAQVEILTYVTQGTFDAYNWQVIARKSRSIEQFKAGESIDSMESLASSGDPQLMIASATNNPHLAEFVQLSAEVERLKLMKASEVADMKEVEQELSVKRNQFKGTQNTIELYGSALPYTPFTGVPISLGKTTFENRGREASAYFQKLVRAAYVAVQKTPDAYYKLGQFGNLPMVAALSSHKGLDVRFCDPVSGEVIPGSGSSVTGSYVMGDSFNSNYELNKLFNAGANLEAYLHSYQLRLETLGQEIEALEAQKAEALVGFSRQAELDEKLARLNVLRADVEIEGMDDDEAGAGQEASGPVLGEEELRNLYPTTRMRQPNGEELREGDLVVDEGGKLHRFVTSLPDKDESKPQWAAGYLVDDVEGDSAEYTFVYARNYSEYTLMGRRRETLTAMEALRLAAPATDVYYRQGLTISNRVVTESLEGKTVSVEQKAGSVLTGTVTAYSDSVLEPSTVQLPNGETFTFQASTSSFIVRDAKTPQQVEAEIAEAAARLAAEEEKKLTEYKLLPGDVLTTDIEKVGKRGYVFDGRYFSDPLTGKHGYAQVTSGHRVHGLAREDFVAGRYLETEEFEQLFGELGMKARVGDLRAGDIVDARKLDPKSSITGQVVILSGSEGYSSFSDIEYRGVDEPEWVPAHKIRRKDTTAIGGVSGRRFGALSVSEKARLGGAQVEKFDSFADFDRFVTASGVEDLILVETNRGQVEAYGRLVDYGTYGHNRNEVKITLKDSEGEQVTHEMYTYSLVFSVITAGSLEEVDLRGIPLEGASAGTAGYHRYLDIPGFVVPSFGSIREYKRVDIAQDSAGMPMEAEGLVQGDKWFETVQGQEEGFEPVALEGEVVEESPVAMSVAVSSVAEESSFAPEILDEEEVELDVPALTYGQQTQGQEEPDLEDSEQEIDGLVEEVAEAAEEAYAQESTEKTGALTEEDAAELLEEAPTPGRNLAAGELSPGDVVVFTPQRFHAQMKHSGPLVGQVYWSDGQKIQLDVLGSSHSRRYILHVNGMPADSIHALYSLDRVEEAFTDYPEAQNPPLEQDGNFLLAAGSQLNPGDKVRYLGDSTVPHGTIEVLDCCFYYDDGLDNEAPQPSYHLTYLEDGIVRSQEFIPENYEPCFEMVQVATDEQAKAAAALYSEYVSTAKETVALEEVVAGDKVAVIGHAIDGKIIEASGEVTALEVEADGASGTVVLEDEAGVETVLEVQQASVQVNDKPAPVVEMMSEDSPEPVAEEENLILLGRVEEAAGAIEDMTVDDAVTETGSEPVTLRYEQVRAGDKIADSNGIWYPVYQVQQMPSGDIELAYGSAAGMFVTTQAASTPITVDPYPSSGVYPQDWEGTAASNLRAGDMLKFAGAEGAVHEVRVEASAYDQFGQFQMEVSRDDGVRGQFIFPPQSTVPYKRPLCEQERAGVAGAMVGVVAQEIEHGMLVHFKNGSAGVVTENVPLPGNGKIRIGVQPLASGDRSLKVWDCEPDYQLTTYQPHERELIARLEAQKVESEKARAEVRGNRPVRQPHQVPGNMVGFQQNLGGLSL
ncbi:DEAD/DEAH box helicase family protein [Rothia nasimurium]|uniref:DEAD/DEAH box helicase family protein n=1 Tax=Rothia nasimurium TaxID=85336 RepID=UPI00143099CC|nr:DEAD/DEAH box helicase family protein [Rothia nasimurium]MBF0808455.1 DEAD/DEAH box helicase family protein [Rothia nasimurium]